MDRTTDESFFRIVYLESSEASSALEDGSHPFQYRIAIPHGVLHVHSPALSEIASKTPLHLECIIPLSVVPFVRLPRPLNTLL
jgi:hypothetical protein